MKIEFKDEVFVFNEKESAEAVRLCTGFLNDMRKQCEEKDILTFYVMLLFIMHDLTEQAINNIGIDGVEAMFMKRIRIEKINQKEDEEEK